jgi:hypothetical protein
MSHPLNQPPCFGARDYPTCPRVRATLGAVAIIGGVHICSWPTVYEQHQGLGSLSTRSCGRRFVREDYFAEDGRWLGAFFDLSLDSEPFPPYHVRRG